MTELILSRPENGLALLTLNRPEKRNALSPGLISALETALESLAREQDLRVLLLTGAGGEAFSAGFDLTALSPGQAAPNKPSGQDPISRLASRLEDFPRPVLAVLNGLTFGGALELALAADIRLAASHARFSMPPARLGLVYSPEGCARFVRAVGLSKAKEMFFTAQAYTAERALAMGLVDHVFSAEELLEAALSLARRIARRAPLANQGNKRVFNLLARSGPLDGPALAEARQLAARAFLSQDLAEGCRAFFEKRSPLFTGQ